MQSARRLRGSLQAQRLRAIARGRPECARGEGDFEGRVKPAREAHRRVVSAAQRSTTPSPFAPQGEGRVWVCYCETGLRLIRPAASKYSRITLKFRLVVEATAESDAD